ncbi:MAG: hypothetical protein AAGC93_17945 [Cyanobacteria bacterium P01_F01_bin.53]
MDCPTGGTIRTWIKLQRQRGALSKRCIPILLTSKLFKALVERMAKQRFQDAFGQQPLGEGEPDVVLPQLIQQGLARLAQDAEYHDFIRVLYTTATLKS